MSLAASISVTAALTAPQPKALLKTQMVLGSLSHKALCNYGVHTLDFTQLHTS